MLAYPCSITPGRRKSRRLNSADVTIFGLLYSASPLVSAHVHTSTSCNCVRNRVEIMLDRRTALCLACSSSLPPNVEDSELFVTKCCGRPICPRCLETNPRLARYNPCLACLAGVGVLQASSSARNRPGVRSVRFENLDGGVKDRDLFVLGDDDEDEDDEDDDDLSTDGEESREVYRSATPPPDVIPTVTSLPATPPPPSVIDYIDTEEASATYTVSAPATPNVTDQLAKQDAPVVYRLRRGDTLTGIALRFRLDVRFFHGPRSFPLLHSLNSISNRSA
jgi:hypothetical protein